MSADVITPQQRALRQELFRAYSDLGLGKPIDVVIAALANSLADAICQASANRNQSAILAIAVSKNLQRNVAENFEAAAAERAAAQEGEQGDG